MLNVITSILNSGCWRGPTERAARGSVAGFKNGRRPGANECGRILKVGEGKEVNSPLEPPEGMRLCQHLTLAQ